MARYLAVGTVSSPFVTIYNVATWGKLTDPVSLPPNVTYEPSFAPDGGILALASSVSPYITRYETAGWTKLANLGTLPTIA